MRALFAGIAVSFVLLVPLAQAEESQLKRLETSHALYLAGVEDLDPLLLLAAAQLRKTVDLTPGSLVPQDGIAEEGAPVLDADQILAAAAPLIAGDPLLEGIAEDIRAYRIKGVRGGPVISTMKIRAKGKDLFPAVPFKGGSYAEVLVEGGDGTEMNLLIHDAKNRLVCSDTDISAIAYCGWHPKKDQNYTITVVNEGSKSSRYSLSSN